MQKYLPLVARVFLSIVFLKAGVSKILGFAGTQAFMAKAGIPLTALVLVFTILFEVVGGLSVLLGYKARWGAIALIIFLVPATLVFHTNFADGNQLNQFLKNLALIGGLLMVVSYGSGPLSLDGGED